MRRRGDGGGGGAFVYSLGQVEALKSDPLSRGSRITTSHKVPGVDALPSGWSYNAGTKRIDNNTGVTAAPLSGWDFSGCWVTIRGNAGLISDCLFDAAGLVAIANLFDLSGAGATCEGLEYCTFVARGFASRGFSSAISERLTTKLGRIHRCAFFGWPTDTIKSASSTIQITENYFDCPVNLPHEPSPWVSEQVYGLDDVASAALLGATRVFISRTTANQGNALPTTLSSNASWLYYDPHCDAINPFASEGDGVALIAGNYISMHPDELEYAGGGATYGINNSVRAIMNQTGNAVQYRPVLIQNNIMTRREDSQSFPVQLPDTTNPARPSSPATLKKNWITPNAANAMWYPGDEINNTISGNIAYYIDIG